MQNVNSRGIGMELARHRKAAGRTLDQLGKQLGMSVSTLSRLENGKRDPTSEEVAAILAILGVTGMERDHLLMQARNAADSLMITRHSGSRARIYQGFEAAATMITSFELMVVPGLAQTAKYAHALLSALRVNDDASVIESIVDQRMSRQAILTRKRPPHVNWILPELALRQPIGGPAVMADQVRHLIELAGLDNVSIRIIPATVAAHAGLSGQFVILDFADQPSLVFVEVRATGLYSDDAADVAGCRSLVENLETVALDKAGSVELMRSISYDLDGLAGGHVRTPDVAKEQLQR